MTCAGEARFVGKSNLRTLHVFFIPLAEKGERRRKVCADNVCRTINNPIIRNTRVDSFIFFFLYQI